MKYPRIHPNKRIESARRARPTLLENASVLLVINGNSRPATSQLVQVDPHEATRRLRACMMRSRPFPSSLERDAAECCCA